MIWSQKVYASIKQQQQLAVSGWKKVRILFVLIDHEKLFGVTGGQFVAVVKPLEIMPL